MLSYAGILEVVAMTEDERKSLREQTLRILETLTPREAQVLKKRFGISTDPQDAPDEAEVQANFEAVQARVREIEARVLARLQKPTRSRMRRSFIGEQE